MTKTNRVKARRPRVADPGLWDSPINGPGTDVELMAGYGVDLIGRESAKIDRELADASTRMWARRYLIRYEVRTSSGIESRQSGPYLMGVTAEDTMIRILGRSDTVPGSAEMVEVVVDRPKRRLANAS